MLHLAWLLPLVARGSVLVPATQPTRITGGEQVAPGAYAEVVAFLVGNNLCTGTLIASDIVLTAAHCLADATPTEVFYGDQMAPERVVPVASVGTHPDFRRNGGEDIYDFAYLRLRSKPANVTPIPPINSSLLWSGAMRVGNEVLLVGYGEDPASLDRDRGIGTKRQVTTVIHEFTPKGTEFIAGGNFRDSCFGDSGGPALVEVEDGVWRLAGVTSRGSDPCGRGGYYGVPAAALCWLRNETGEDLTDATCSDCSCVSKPSAQDSGCSVTPSRPQYAYVAWALLVLMRRRRASPRARNPIANPRVEQLA